ncbi:hypothetical protein QTP88_001561 [Uroleucon formosanum]
MPPKLRRSSRQTPMPQKRRRTSTETTESQQGSFSEMPTEPQIKQTSELLPAPVPFKWTTERSVELLFSMIGLKPVGLKKHINVMLIKQRVSKRLNMNVPIGEIWKFLHAHWNLELASMEKTKREEWAKFIEEGSTAWAYFSSPARFISDMKNPAH